MKILFYPQVVHNDCLVAKLCKRLGYEITCNLKYFNLAFYWQPDTKRNENSVLSSLNRYVINVNCHDISKTKVMEVFEEIFGYSISPDGKQAVKKSDINSKRDGEIVDWPCKIEDGFVYQKIINNVVEASSTPLVVDYRTFVWGKSIPYVYAKYRDVADRFGKSQTYGELCVTSKIFTQEEQGKIIDFARRMNLDFGELDILRDNDDGKIYIVDCNRETAGTSEEKFFREEWMNKLTNSFATYLEEAMLLKKVTVEKTNNITMRKYEEDIYRTVELVDAVDAGGIAVKIQKITNQFTKDQIETMRDIVTQYDSLKINDKY